MQVFGITDATAITAGDSHSCALRRDGTISCWGGGQLGNGTNWNSSVPVQVEGIADATAIAAGGGHSCALRRGGTISCWGDNFRGRLGNGQSGNNAGSLIPVQVEGIADATAIAAGGGHSCALRRGGTISCWGANWDGRLGNGQSGNNAGSLIPVQVEGIADATAIAAGSGHSCALRRGGTISCWGGNYWGQLGNGTNWNSSVPVQVEGIADATAIAAGSGHSCALRRGGTISCWGGNFRGRLGNGTTRDSSIPVQVTGFGG